MGNILIKSLTLLGFPRVVLGLLAVVAFSTFFVGCQNHIPDDVSGFTPSKEACVTEEGVFTEGFNGTCSATAPGQFDMEFRNNEGAELFKYTWLSEENLPSADCSSLCSASAFYWAGTPNVALLFAYTTAIAVLPTCSGGTFDCFGCCGKGCLATLAVPVGACGPNGQCVQTEFQGYTKTCCFNHDGCVTSARTIAEHIACAVIAAVEGCELKDAWGGGSGTPCTGTACLLP